MSKHLFLCTQCRKKLEDVDQCLFVDQSTNRPFCSESCIMEFHAPYMESFEREELEHRHFLSLGTEQELDSYYQRHDLFQLTLNNPEEVWFEKNGIGEEYYTHISSFDVDGGKIFYILVCSYFENAPSFVFFKCISANEKLARFFKTGNLKKAQGSPALAMDEVPSKEASFAPKESEDFTYEVEDAQAQIQIPQESLEDLELKKSEYLAMLLEKRDDSDIPFERFNEYDEYLSLTIEDPDETFSGEDESGDEIRTYIKSFKANGKAFYYVAICLKIPVKDSQEHEALLPIISFPSTDQELYKVYAVGERVEPKLKS